MVMFFSFLIAMLVTMALIPPLMRSAAWLQIVDLPNERKVHSGAIPRVGGLAMVAGAVLPPVLWLLPSPEVLGLLLGMAVILGFGLWDDRVDLDYRLKFAGQCLAALIVWWAGVRVDEWPVLGEVAPWLSLPLTVFALLAITNAINLADGLDGLAGGSVLLSLAGIALLAYMANLAAPLLIALAVMGSLLGFLRFNTYPARVFMGDGGSQFLGFATGVLAILLTQNSEAGYSLSLPILLLGLPILDTILVMVRRLREGRSPFSADKNHIHHRLLALGLDHYQAVFVIYVVQAVLVTAAYYLRDAPDAWILTGYLLCCAVVVTGLMWAGGRDWRRASAGGNRELAGDLFGVRLERITQWGVGAAAFSMPLYLLSGGWLAQAPSADMTWLAAGLLMFLLLWWGWRRGPTLSLPERGAVYLAGAWALYHVQRSALEGPWIALSNVYFVLLAVTVAVAFRCSRDRRFAATPLDFLVVFLVVVFPQVPGLDVGYPQDFARLIVLFYAIELVLTHLRRADWVRITTCVLLGLPLLHMFM